MNKQIGIIGAGNMGLAIISGIHTKYKLHVCEKDKSKCQLLKRRFKIKAESLEDVIEKSQIIILAVKPQNFEQVLDEIKPLLDGHKLIISIAAGITCSFIEKRLAEGSRVVRSMPNLPAQTLEAMTAICLGRYAYRSDLIVTCQIFSAIGKAVVVEEKLMDAITAVSGSGPAYVFYFLECFIEASESIGLSHELSMELVKQTLRGSLSLLESSKEEVSELRKRVTSKGGTTHAALNVLFKNKYKSLFKLALRSAKSRSKELAK